LVFYSSAITMLHGPINISIQIIQLSLHFTSWLMTNEIILSLCGAHTNVKYKQGDSL